MPQCVTSCGTRTACPGQPVSTLTAAGLRPYSRKALRHDLVPDALLTGVPTHRRQDAVPALCPKTTPSRRIQVTGAVALKGPMLFQLAEIVAELVQPVGFLKESK